MEYGPARRKCSLGRKSVRARERALRPRGVGGAPACRGGRQGQNFQRGSDRGEPRRAGADDFSSNSGGNFPDTGGKLCPQKSVVMGSTVGPDHRVIRSRGHRLELWEGRSGGAPPWITLRAAQGLEPDAKGRLPGLAVAGLLLSEGAGKNRFPRPTRLTSKYPRLTKSSMSLRAVKLRQRFTHYLELMEWEVC